jgi:hypothetical protein
MQLPLGFGQFDFGDWLYGLFSGFISGGATAIVSTFGVSAIDPGDVNLQHPAKFFAIMGVIFLVSGAISAANFLVKRPLPGVKQVTTMTQTVTGSTGTGDGSTTKVIETVKETHTEPMPPKKESEVK